MLSCYGFKRFQKRFYKFLVPGFRLQKKERSLSVARLSRFQILFPGFVSRFQDSWLVLGRIWRGDLSSNQSHVSDFFPVVGCNWMSKPLIWQLQNVGMDQVKRDQIISKNVYRKSSLPPKYCHSECGFCPTVYWVSLNQAGGQNWTRL